MTSAEHWAAVQSLAISGIYSHHVVKGLLAAANSNSTDTVQTSTILLSELSRNTVRYFLSQIIIAVNIFVVIIIELSECYAIRATEQQKLQGKIHNL